MGLCSSSLKRIEVSRIPELTTFHGLKFWVSSCPSVKTEPHAAGASQRKAAEQKPGSGLMIMALACMKQPYFQPWFCFRPATVLCKVQTLLGECRNPVAGGRRLLSALAKEIASRCPQSCGFCCISQMKRDRHPHQPLFYDPLKHPYNNVWGKGKEHQ